MITVSGLYVYPVKSCRGIPLSEARIDDRGFEFDRRWMVVDTEGRFVSQRAQPALARISQEIDGGLLRLTAHGMPVLEVQEEPAVASPRPVTIWKDTVLAESTGPRAARWFSNYLGAGFELVRMPETSVRRVDPRYSDDADRVGFADGFPFLLLSEGSLDGLNRRLERPVPMDRFRPNIVVGGCDPHAEDSWSSVRIGEVSFRVVKPCARCVITTTDQLTGERSPEPLRTLATYRRQGGGVMFGQNLIHDGPGVIRVGDRCVTA